MTRRTLGGHRQGLGRQKSQSQLLQYHFPQKPPADSRMKRGREAPLSPLGHFPGLSGFLWGFHRLCVGPEPSSVVWEQESGRKEVHSLVWDLLNIHTARN